MAYTNWTTLFDITRFTHRVVSGGVGVVSGITQIEGVEAPCRVTLLASDGTRIDFKLTDDTGLYSFTQLAPGGYTIIVEDDARRVKQPLIIYTTVS